MRVVLGTAFEDIGQALNGYAVVFRHELGRK